MGKSLINAASDIIQIAVDSHLPTASIVHRDTATAQAYTWLCAINYEKMPPVISGLDVGRHNSPGLWTKSGQHTHTHTHTHALKHRIPGSPSPGNRSRWPGLSLFLRFHVTNSYVAIRNKVGEYDKHLMRWLGLMNVWENGSYPKLQAITVFWSIGIQTPGCPLPNDWIDHPPPVLTDRSLAEAMKEWVWSYPEGFKLMRNHWDEEETCGHPLILSECRMGVNV